METERQAVESTAVSTLMPGGRAVGNPYAVIPRGGIASDARTNWREWLAWYDRQPLRTKLGIGQLVADRYARIALRVRSWLTLVRGSPRG